MNDHDGDSQLQPFLLANTRVYHEFIPLSNAVDVYLEKCRNNVLAEFACLLREGSNGVDHLDGTRVVGLVANPHSRSGGTWLAIRVKTTTGDDDDDFFGVPPLRKLQRAGFDWLRTTDEVAPQDLHHHALVWERRLHIAVYDKRSKVTRLVTAGAILDGEQWRHTPGHLMDLGYIGDAIHEAQACARLQVTAAAPSAILIAIASPDARRPAEFVSGAIEPSVPINARQLQVLQGLRYNLEGICGPPGTVRASSSAASAVRLGRRQFDE